jgi:deoxyribodipyrimidine photo-lyase
MSAVLWLRRDLRLHDHPALHSAAALGPVLPVFVLDPGLWGPAGGRRRGLLAASLIDLDARIRQLGGPGVRVLAGDPAQVLAPFAAGRPVLAAADFGPYGRRRDEAVAAAVDLRLVGSPYRHAPGTVRKPNGTAYRVFTPYWKAWRDIPDDPVLPAPQTWPGAGALPGADTADGEGWAVLRQQPAPPFPVGEDAAWHRWQQFAKHGLAGYGERRNLPAAEASSGLSAALKLGELHPRSIAADARGRPGAEAFVRQLCWRDFYAQVLWDAPGSARANYQPAFDALPWASGPAADAAFRAWTAGRTGYPFVDAGMRHLAQRGTLPNRLRMVVASFLVKDLAVDWRRGARWFMQQLYDGDLANNQHGWQWTAGTGTDAAPYYRIFNPVAQGLRFDPDGDYVRTWVPELRGLPGTAAHEPWLHPRERWTGYPDRIVDHASARAEALARYEAVKAAGRGAAAAG